MKILIGIVMLAAAVLGVAIYRKCRGLERIDRAIAAVMPALAGLLGIEIVLNIMTEPLFNMNSVRLARTFGLYHGVKLYPGANATGPILGTLHTPMSHILFWPAIFAPTPASAICIASTLAFVLVFAPLVWLHWPRVAANSRSVLLSSFAFITCACILLRADSSSGIRACIFHIHSDAAAICFATLAAGVIFRAKANPGWGCLLLSSAFAALALGSKQTMAPVLVAICFFLLIADGLRTALRYAVCLLGSGLVFSAIIVYLLGPANDILFNIVALAAHRPRNSGSLMEVFRPVYEDVILQGLSVIFCLLLFLLYWYFYERSQNNRWRQMFSTYRWIVFVLAGLLLIPVCVKAQTTFGGDLNHVGMFCFFLSVGTTLGLSQLMNDRSTSAKPAAGKLVATALIVVCLPGLFVELPLLLLRPVTSANELSVSYRYALKHPGKAYFPRYPLSEFYAEHRFYHFDGSLLDREVTGHKVSQAQFDSGLPGDFSVVALSKGQPVSQVLSDYLAGWPQINDPELPGWIVYQRPSTGSLTPQP